MEQSTFQALVTGWMTAVPMLTVLVLLMLLDIITGLLKASIGGELSSSASLRGMLQKVMMLAIVACGRLMEYVIPSESLPWSGLAATFFCVTELISIFENAVAAGVPVPEQMRNALQAMRSSKGRLQLPVTPGATPDEQTDQAETGDSATPLAHRNHHPREPHDAVPP